MWGPIIIRRVVTRTTYVLTSHTWSNNHTCNLPFFKTVPLLNVSAWIQLVFNCLDPHTHAEFGLWYFHENDT